MVNQEERIYNTQIGVRFEEKRRR